jgi:hypothetical protein
VNENRKKENINFKRIIISKIVIELINSYKRTDNYNEIDDKELEQNELDNNNIIKNNISIFEDLHLKWSVNEFKKKN